MHAGEMDDAPEDMRGLRGKYRHTKENKFPVLCLLHGYGNVRSGGDDFYSFIEEELPDFVCGRRSDSLPAAVLI